VSLRYAQPGQEKCSTPLQGMSEASTTVEDCGPSLAEEPHHALLLLYGRADVSRRIIALGTESLHIGRAVDGEHRLRLPDPRASRRHAEIHWSEVHRRHRVRDLGSRNGVILNGTRVTREFLSPGDVLRIGNAVFRIAAAPPDAPQVDTIEPPFVGESQSLRLTIDRALRVAASDVPVLILGPTGTGKELLAEAIHRASGRTGPLTAVNCAALPTDLVESELFGHEKGAFSGADSARRGLFRAAQAGTLFLDEVGELPVDIQAKLLRALDTRSIRPVGAVAEAPVDVRVVAATNRDLTAEVNGRGFRADLYARLAESVVQVDPLRERPEDLEPLWRHFVAEFGDGVTVELSAAAFEAMALHSWPYNVRELRQLVRTALLLKPDGGELAVEDLPAAMRPAGPDTAARGSACSPAARQLVPGETPNRRQLRQLVEEFQGNVKKLAAFLGKDRKQVYRWLQREKIDPDAYRLFGD